MQQNQVAKEVSGLLSFDGEERKTALLQIIQRGDLDDLSGDNGNVNLHLHSFFSYNAEGWSPVQIALESKRCGLHSVGIIDFDVLDGLAEFIWAGDQLGLKTSVGLETRSFLGELADSEIDSPGEPGVSYIAGAGFNKVPEEGTPEAVFLQELFDRSKQRNIALISRINEKIPHLAIDYESDVLPLTPSGNATERHIVRAYIAKSRTNSSANALATAWSDVLGKSKSEVSDLLKDAASLEDIVRSKLAKRGGLGYVQPSAETFPETGKVFAWMKACGAIPMESWLDGTSDGEKDASALLELSWSQGARALNIIPDRNWNIKDPGVKSIKVSNLRDIIKTADTMGMPIHIGTEMNKAGQPFYDDLNGPVLREFRDVILKGSRIVLGHNVLSRFTDVHYVSDDLDGAQDKKNNLFEKVGLLESLSNDQAKHLLDAGATRAFDLIMESGSKGKWMFN
jgi:hypothetical protein